MFHAKGNKKGPYNLDKVYTKEEGFFKTQAVVLDLLLQRDDLTDEPLYPPNKHMVWLDNLFISVKLLSQLQKAGISASGTIRTTKTKQEEQEEASGEVKAQHRAPIEQISSSLAELKLVFNNQIPWGSLYGELSEDSTVAQFAWKDSNIVLFISTILNGKFTT